MTAGTSATASSKCGLRVYRAEAWDLRSASGGGLSPGAPASLWERGARCLGLALQASSPQCRPCLGCSSLYPEGSIFKKSKWAWPHLFIQGCLKPRHN